VADAVATSLGNSIKEKDASNIQETLEAHTSIYGIEAALVIIDDLLGYCGDIPEIVRAKVNYELITKG
jgi:hypothetical protein